MANTDMRRRLAMMLGDCPVTIKGVAPITTARRSLLSLKAFGGTEQNGTPTPDAPVDIVSNNGVIKARHQSGLPIGYTLLEYIESTGTQYIDTGYKLESNNVVYEWAGIDKTISGNNSLFGAQGEGTSKYSGIPYGNNVLRRFYTGSLSSVYLGYVSNDTSLHTWRLILNNSTQTLVKDSSIVGTSSFTGTLQKDYNIFVFANNLTGSATQQTYVAMEYFRIIDNGEIVFNGFSARRNSDNLLGMYDTVSGQFFTNAGTGDFVAGNEVADPLVGYADGTVETIQVTGKNLFDVSDYDTSSDWIGSNYKYVEIPLHNGTYTISWDIYKGNSYMYWLLQVTESVIGTSTPGTGGSWLWHADIAALQKEKFTFTVTEGKVWFTCAFGQHFNDFLACLETVQIEEGSYSTPYEPYYNGDIATAEMLLKVGDYQDVQEILSGAVTRNVGVKVLDGTEYWNGGIAAGVPCVQISKTEFGISSDTLPNNSLDLICTHYKAVNGSDWSQSIINTIKVGTNYLFFNTQYVQDYTSFKQFLADQYAAGTPVIIVYPLASPVTETVAGQTLALTNGTNVIDITQASLDNLELEVKVK